MINLKKIAAFASFVLMMTVSIFIITAPNSSAGTPVGGYIDTDTVWNRRGSPYWVESDVIVRNGTNLTIEIGIDVLFNDTYNIYIEEGAVFWVAQVSTRRYYALFTWNPDKGAGSPGSWGAIQFNGSSYDYSEIVFARIEYATCGIRLESASPTIRNCTIRNSTYGIYSNYGSPLIKNNTVENCVEDGIYIKDYDLGNGYPILNNNIVANNTKRGIVMYDTTKTQLRNNTIVNSSYNFGVWGDWIDEFDHDIDTTNTVDDKPIYYWKGRNDESIPSDAGYVGIVNSTNITVEDLTLTNNGQGVLVASAPANTDYIRINNVTACDNELGVIIFGSSNDYIENSNISNNDFNGYTPYGSASGMYVEQSMTLNVSNSTISSNSGTGIYLAQTSNSNIINNTVCSNGGSGIIVEGPSGDMVNLTSNNVSLNGGHGIQISISDENNISSNNISYNNNNGIYFTYSDENNVISNNIYSNSEYGIEFLYSSNNVVTNSNISNNDKGIHSFHSPSNYFVECNITNNNQQGIFIKHSNWNNITQCFISENDRGIFIWSENTNVTSCNITHNDDGILFQVSSNNNISKCNISSNDYGLYYNSYLATGDEIYDNIIGWNSDAGIYCIDDNYPIIKDNKIIWNEDIGIECISGSYPTITYNNLENNTNYGVYCESSSDPTIKYNTIKNNDYGIFSKSGSDPIINNNTISHNTQGIYCEYYCSPNITWNDIHNNTDAGVNCTSGTNATIHYNNIEDNLKDLNDATSGYGVNNQDSGVTIDATYNWWGDASGPYHNPDNLFGEGNQVSDNVDFDYYSSEPY